MWSIWDLPSDVSDFQSPKSVSSTKLVLAKIRHQYPVYKRISQWALCFFGRVSRHIIREWFALVTSENQLTLNVDKVRCALGVCRGL